MPYKVNFVLDGREAELLEDFPTEQDAREAAVGLEECGAITEINEV